MSALLHPPRERVRTALREAESEQESLFGPSRFGAAAPVAAPALAPAPPPEAPVDPRERPGAAGILDGPSLDDVISHTWESLRAQVAAACPVCGGEMEPLGSLEGGRCGDCGSSVD